MVQIIVLSILYTFLYVTNVLAFQTTPSSSKYGVVGNSKQHSIFIHHPSHPSHPSTALQLDAKNDGYDDWYIDDEEYNKSPVKNDISSANSSGSKSTSTASANDNNDTSDEQQMIRTYFATCIPGLHNSLYNELITLGAINVETQGKSGVRFQGNSKVGLKSILWCRTAHKIMELIASSSDPPQLDDDNNSSFGSYDYNSGIQTKDDLYHFVKTSIHTPSLLGDGEGGLLTLSVSTIYASKPPNKELCHSHYTALTVKNALVDSVRELRDDGIRPNVDIYNPDVPLVVVLKGRRVNNGRSRGGRNDYNSYDAQEDDEMGSADVDVYRCLHTQGSLHRRGYRSGNDSDSSWNDEEEETEWEINNGRRRSNRPQEVSSAPIHKAAMKETMAAGLLLEAGWDKLVSAARGDSRCAVLVDPMTGSGTLPVEAALIACDMAPGLLRIASWRSSGDDDSQNTHRFPPCIRWKDFTDQTTWDGLLDKATGRAKAGVKWARSISSSEEEDGGHKNVKILCNEMNPRAYSLALASIRSAGVGALVSLSEGDCVDWDLGGDKEETSSSRDIIQGRTIFVCNPPWGLRLTDDIDESWVSLREFLRREAGGCESWVLSGNKDLTKILRMRTSRKVPVQTAGEDLRWLQYHIFQKSKNKIEA